MPAQVLVLVLVLEAQVLVLVLVLESQVLDKNAHYYDQ